MADNRKAIAYAVSTGHAFDPDRGVGKHAAEFKDPSLGPVLDVYDGAGKPDPVKMTNYLDDMMSRPDTQVLTSPSKPPVTYIYNPTDNVMLVLDPANTGDFGTVYRPDDGPDKIKNIQRGLANEYPHAPPAIRGGANAVTGAIQKIQDAILKNPKAADLLNQKAGDLGVDVVRPAKPAPVPPQPAPDLPDPNTQLADKILQDPDTKGFWADKNGRVMHFLSETDNAVVTITDTGDKKIHVFDTPEEARKYFGEKMDRSWKARGEKPSIHTGSADDLADTFRKTRGIWPKITGGAADVGRFLGKVAKVLGPLGVVGSAAEAAELGHAVHEAARYGIISEDALLEYDALLALHIAQATADPTMVGGEAAIQLAFEEWCEKHNIPDHIRDTLEPSSLIEMIIGDIKIKETMNALPSGIDQDMPNEVRTLIQLRGDINYAMAGETRRAIDPLSPEPVTISVEEAQLNLREAYKTMEANGQIHAVAAYIEKESFLQTLPGSTDQMPVDAPVQLAALVAAKEPLTHIDEKYMELNRHGFQQNPEAAEKAVQLIDQRRDAKTLFNETYEEARNGDEWKSISDYLEKLKTDDTPDNSINKIEDKPSETMQAWQPVSTMITPT